MLTSKETKLVAELGEALKSERQGEQWIEMCQGHQDTSWTQAQSLVIPDLANHLVSGRHLPPLLIKGGGGRWGRMEIN